MLTFCNNFNDSRVMSSLQSQESSHRHDNDSPKKTCVERQARQKSAAVRDI